MNDSVPSGIPRGVFNTNKWNRIRYSIWAPFYNAIAPAFGSKRRRSIQLAAIQPGERVLLLGAGTGLDLDFLPRGAAITAIDITPAMVSRVQSRARRLGLAVDARVMDGQALEFADASFDVVVLHLIVAVIPDPVMCLKEAARVMRPGGRAVVLDKFVPDGRPAPWWLRLFRPFLSLLATEITRQLGPIVAESGMQIIHREDAGLRGLFQIAVLHSKAKEA